MAKQQDKSRLAMPTNVRRFVWLWWGSVGIALAGVPLTPSTNSSELLALGLTRADVMAIQVGSAAIIIALLLPFFWFAVWRRKNWARWVLLVAFAVSVPISLGLMALNPTFSPEDIPQTGIEFVSLLIEAAAFYFLFTGNARAWFEREKLELRH